jgi:hypothetical protein
MNTNEIDPAVVPTETAKFLAWYDSERQKGLVDIKFDVGDLRGATVESFFKEVNEALAAPSVPDLAIF